MTVQKAVFPNTINHLKTMATDQKWKQQTTVISVRDLGRTGSANLSRSWGNINKPILGSLRWVNARISLIETENAMSKQNDVKRRRKHRESPWSHSPHPPPPPSYHQHLSLSLSLATQRGCFMRRKTVCITATYTKMYCIYKQIFYTFTFQCILKNDLLSQSILPLCIYWNTCF